MFLIQIVLPLFDNNGQAFTAADFALVRRELTEVFGGATAYSRAPAQGTWEDSQGRIRHDDVIVIEVQSKAIYREWWSRYKAVLSARFRQDDLLVRAISIEVL